ncbi:MAG: hypothetical protein ACRDRS_21110 [Pseudonocardiaceae bacterium]
MSVEARITLTPAGAAHVIKRLERLRDLLPPTGERPTVAPGCEQPMSGRDTTPARWKR